MIHLIITWCMVLNPTMCHSVEIVPHGGREITSISDCLMGGAIAAATDDQGIEWKYEIHCSQSSPSDVATWLRDKRLEKGN